MAKEEKNEVGVSLFGQSDMVAGSDPIEEMFALNLGDFISETLISEEFAKKISISANKKDRIKNQLKELTDIYSTKNTLCVLNFTSGEQQAIYTSIAKSVVQMLEVKECKIYLIKDDELVVVGNSSDTKETTDISLADLIYEDIIEKGDSTCISMRSSTLPVGMIEIKADNMLY